MTTTTAADAGMSAQAARHARAANVNAQSAAKVSAVVPASTLPPTRTTAADAGIHARLGNCASTAYAIARPEQPSVMARASTLPPTRTTAADAGLHADAMRAITANAAARNAAPDAQSAAIRAVPTAVSAVLVPSMGTAGRLILRAVQSSARAKWALMYVRRVNHVASLQVD
jgi:hypothetical protein